MALLRPFWPVQPENSSDPQSGTYDEFTLKSSSLFQLTNLEEADFVLIPADWHQLQKSHIDMELTQELIE